MTTIEDHIRDMVYEFVEEAIKDALDEIKMDISSLADDIAELREEVKHAK